MLKFVGQGSIDQRVVIKYFPVFNDLNKEQTRLQFYGLESFVVFLFLIPSEPQSDCYKQYINYL